MAFGRYLRRRGHTWFFRLRWPAALAACKVSGEVIVSLRTGDYRLALHRARVLRLQADLMMARFTPTTTKAEAETAIRGWIDRCVWRREANCAETGGIALLDPAEIETMGRQDAAELDGLLQVAGRRYHAEEKTRIAGALGSTGPGLEAYAGIIDAAGRDIGVSVDRTTNEGRLLARTVLRGYATLLGEMQQVVADIPRQAQAAVTKPLLPDFPFFTYWDEFVATKKSDRKWKRDTAGGAEASPRLFKALIGDLPFAKIDGDVVGRFRREYLKLPYNHFHDGTWKKLTPQQAIAAMEKLDDEARGKIRTTSTTSANKHISNLI
jgi:hypothetical protein